VTWPKSFDRVAHAYDVTRGLPADVEAAVADGIATLVRSLGVAPSLLDVGVGTGRIAAPVSVRGVRVTGVDVSTKMLAVLREKRSAVRAVVADAARLPFARGSFDAALLVHVLHLVDPRPVLDETARIVRAGGLVLRGRTDYDGPHAEFGRLVDAVGADVAALPPRERECNADATAAFAAFVHGLHATTEERLLARWTDETTGEALIVALEGRLFSSWWRIPDAALPAIVTEVRARATALYGDLARPLRTSATFSLGVVRVP
jgi:SAM-dependent methyltransferase